MEVQPLSTMEIDLKHHYKDSRALLLWEEEVRLKQLDCYRVTIILNTFTSRPMENTEKHIFCLEQDEGVIEGDENLKKFITNYYKDHDMLQAKELKLVLSTFEQLSGLKLFFTKVNFYAMARLRTVNWNMHICLGVG